MSSYRPISLLFNIDKTFEKLMHSRLIDFLEEKKSLYYKQFGFRKYFSTTDVILKLLEFIQKALDEGQFACGIGHWIPDILFEKLDHYSIRDMTNDLLRSYLYDRFPFVTINGFNSDYKT